MLTFILSAIFMVLWFGASLYGLLWLWKHVPDGERWSTSWNLALFTLRALGAGFTIASALISGWQLLILLFHHLGLEIFATAAIILAVMGALFYLRDGIRRSAWWITVMPGLSDRRRGVYLLAENLGFWIAETLIGLLGVLLFLEYWLYLLFIVAMVFFAICASRRRPRNGAFMIWYVVLELLLVFTLLIWIPAAARGIPSGRVTPSTSASATTPASASPFQGVSNVGWSWAEYQGRLQDASMPIRSAYTSCLTKVTGVTWKQVTTTYTQTSNTVNAVDARGVLAIGSTPQATARAELNTQGVARASTLPFARFNAITAYDPLNGCSESTLATPGVVVMLTVLKDPDQPATSTAVYGKGVLPNGEPFSTES